MKHGFFCVSLKEASVPATIAAADPDMLLQHRLAPAGQTAGDEEGKEVM